MFGRIYTQEAKARRTLEGRLPVKGPFPYVWIWMERL